MAKHFLSAILLAGIFVSSLVLARQAKEYHLPGNQEGYEPEQPIAFSHRQHAGQMQISCLYCHFGADSSKHAGFPPGSVCMTCHRFVTAPQKDLLPEILEARIAKRAPKPLVSPELQKLYDAMGLDDKLQPDSQKKPSPIKWVRVHNLPDFACFDHRAHVRTGVKCEQCHGQVETMERVRQFTDLSMGWCVNCHRESERTGVEGKAVRPSTDCSTCHH